MFTQTPAKIKFQLNSLLDNSVDNSVCEFDAEKVKNLKNINDRIACLGYGVVLSQQKQLPLHDLLSALHDNHQNALTQYFAKHLMARCAGDHETKSKIPAILKTLTPFQREFLYYAAISPNKVVGLQNFENSGIQADTFLDMVKGTKQLSDRRCREALKQQGLCFILEELKIGPWKFGQAAQIEKFKSKPR
jgi:hypothetical protein